MLLPAGQTFVFPPRVLLSGKMVVGDMEDIEAGPARGGFRGYIVLGPWPRGPGGVQVSALSFGIVP